MERVSNVDFWCYINRWNMKFPITIFLLNVLAFISQSFVIDFHCTEIAEYERARSGSYDISIVLKNVLFDSGSSKIGSSYLKDIDKLKRVLVQHQDYSCEIRGHADNIGTEADNMKLSVERAKRIFDYLVDKGIPADRMTYKGFGETQPMAPNDTEERRQMNRRVEFALFETKSSN